MSQSHRFILEPYKGIASRHSCPACNEKKKFSRYFDTVTNEQLADDCGRCERSDGCGYHKTPSDYFKDNPTDKPNDFQKWQPVPAPPLRLISFIDYSIFKKTLGINNTNTFTTFLIALFGNERAESLVNKYHIGTTKTGEVIFYQVDLQGNVRSGKVMKYNLIDSNQTALGKDCKRDKGINPNWVHSKLKLENFNLKQSLVGEHLINETQTIAIVESAKTAIIASVYFPSYVWVSCEGKEGLSLDKLKVLKGKNVILFPDLKGFDKWFEKSKQMTFCKSIVVSDLLEQVATDAERASGLDLADYLLRLPAPAEALPAVATDTHESVVVENDEVAKRYPIEEVPFWEEIITPDTPLTPLEIRAKLVAEWFVTHGDVFDGTFVLDNLAIPDIRKVIVHHLQIIDKNESSSILSTKFLERVKVAFRGA